MTVRYEIRGALPVHADVIGAFARQADRVELAASSGTTPREAMLRGMEHSELCWTGLADDVPILMFGVATASILGGVGVPWMIGSVLVDGHQFGFIRRCRPCVGAMKSRYTTLANWVDARNVGAHRWLRWMGFTLGAPEPYGINGEPFLPFVWTRPMAGAKANV